MRLQTFKDHSTSAGLAPTIKVVGVGANKWRKYLLGITKRGTLLSRACCFSQPMGPDGSVAQSAPETILALLLSAATNISQGELT